MVKLFPQTILLVLVFAVGAVHAETAEEFGARRSPADPVLELNREPELCSKVSAAMVSAHRGSDFVLNGAAIITNEFTRVDMQTMDVPAGSRSGTSLQRADLDLDGTGQLNTVVLRTSPFNWSGDRHDGHIFATPAAFESEKERWSAGGDEPLPGSRAFYPSATRTDAKPASVGNDWAAPVLFVFAKRYYVVYTPNDFEAQSPISYSVYRLRASGDVDVACNVDQRNIAALHYRFETLPEVEALLGVIQTIGNPGPDSGTMHAETQHLAAAKLGEQVAAARPWAIAGRAESAAGPRDYHRHGPRLERLLDVWSKQEPWARREYQTLQALMRPAVLAYAGYLQREFGVSADRAGAAATDVLLGLLAQYILVPAQFEEYEPMADWVERGAVSIVTRDRAAFDLMVGQAKGSDAGQPEVDLSRLLPLAIEWPYAFDRLLTLGANPDLGNNFGKTPLMTAAHFNRPDAVRKLLKAGAKVDARTVRHSEYGYDVQRGNRTALMYAAENAGPVVIKLLLDAGADPRLADSRDATFAAYLEWNPRFTPAERDRLKRQPDTMATPDASFDCAKAEAAVDRAICGSEVLRIFDREIAAAYARLKQRRGEILVTEQRAWLNDRNRACGARPDEDCLAEILRTRVRVLHKRLEERIR